MSTGEDRKAGWGQGQYMEEGRARRAEEGTGRYIKFQIKASRTKSICKQVDLMSPNISSNSDFHEPKTLLQNIRIHISMC